MKNRLRKRIVSLLLAFTVCSCSGCRFVDEIGMRFGISVSDIGEKIGEKSWDSVKALGDDIWQEYLKDNGRTERKTSVGAEAENGIDAEAVPDNADDSSVLVVEEELPVSDLAEAKAAAISLGLCGSAEDGEAVLAERYVVETKGAVCYRMNQMYQGIPVYQHNVSVVADEEGRASLAAGNYVEIGQVNTEPALDEAGLAEAVGRYVEETYPGADLAEVSFVRDEDTPLTIFVDDEDEAHLAWMGRLYVPGKSGSQIEILIDGEDGRVLYSVNLVVGVERYFYRFQPQGHDKEIQLYFDLEKMEEEEIPPYVLIRDMYWLQDSEKGIYLYEGLDKESMNTSGPKDVKSFSWQGISRCVTYKEEPEVKGIQTYVMATASYDFFLNVLERKGFDNQNGNLCLYYDASFDDLDALNPKNLRSNVVNGSSWICVGHKAEPGDWNVVAHEYTHTVTLFMNGAYGDNAVMEAYSDCFAEVMEAYYTGEDPDWEITGADRRLKPEDGKKKTLTQIYDYQYYERGMECHKASTIGSYAVYKIWDSWRNQGMSVEEAAETMATFLYRSLFVMPGLPYYEDFAKALDATAQAMENQGAITQKQEEAVRQALAEVGFSFTTASHREVQYAENAEDVVSECRILVKDGVTGEAISGAKVDILWSPLVIERSVGLFDDEVIASQTTDSEGMLRISNGFYSRLGLLNIRISAPGYETVTESAKDLIPYLPLENVPEEDRMQNINIFSLYPEGYRGGEITAAPEDEEKIGDSSESAETEALTPEQIQRQETLMRQKLAQLGEEYGRIGVDADYMAEGERGLISQAIPPEVLTGVLCGHIHDYDGDGGAELLVLRGDGMGSGYQVGTSNHITAVDIYLSMYDMENGTMENGTGQVSLADEIRLRMPGLPDTNCFASLQMFMTEGTEGSRIYLDYMLNMNAQSYGVVGLSYGDGAFSILGGVENTEWPNYAGAYISDRLENRAGLLGLCERISRTTDAESGGDREGWQSGQLYDWSWTEEPQGSGGDLDEYLSASREELERIGLKEGKSRSYLKASSVTTGWIGESCFMKPSVGYASLDGDIVELCGMHSVRGMDGLESAMSLLCYNTAE